MTKPIVISVDGEPQGVVVPNGSDYRFMAVKLGVFPLDGKVFDSVGAAREAARTVVAQPENLTGPLTSGSDDDSSSDLVA